MKNILCIVFFFITIINVSAFSGGTGTYNDPYQVNNLTDLNDVRNYLSSYFIQTDDISIGFNYNTPLGWLPIGDYSNPFTGYYDGYGFVITAMKIDRPNTDYIGLFGYTYRAVLKNITINDSEISGNDYVGLLVGYFLGISADSHYIDNCFVHAVSEGHDCVGGLAGYVSQSKVIYSAASADVTGNEYVGGLIGMCKSAEIEYCDRINEKSITGGGNVGGLVGLNDRSSSIINCRSQESLVFGETNVGGLVGWNYDKSEVLSSSTQGGTVTSTIVAGGLVGRHEDDAIIDDGCYTTSCVVTAECMAGGIIGISSYAIVRDSDVESTDIIADYCLGGLIGHEEESYIADCPLIMWR